MRPPNSIQTRRLELRVPSVGDAEAIFADYAQDTEVTKYVVWSPHKEIGETRDFLRACLRSWENGPDYPYVMVRKSDARLLGTINMIIHEPRVVVGYVVAREHWGQGFAPEALRALIDWALAQDDIYRVGALCDCENRASVRVMQKSGMSLEGTLRRYTHHSNIGPLPRDVFSYAIVK
jgi:[ribosomal protein S5]-alanine N-acetyltransferase